MGVDINGQSPSRHIEKHVHGREKYIKSDPKMEHTVFFACGWMID